MTPPPPPSRREHQLAYREARLRRSLARLRAHPAVNPAGPHGPRGSLVPSISPASSSLTHSPSNSLSDLPALPNHRRVPPGIIPALFNDLVKRELGIDPTNDPAKSRLSRALTKYLSASRAVTTAPNLSNSSLRDRLATGHSPATLTDHNLVSTVVTPPLHATLHMPRARDIHIAIQKAAQARKALPVPVSKPREQVADKLPTRTPTRKRLRSQTDPLATTQSTPAKSPLSSLSRHAELKPFTPSAECVRKTRSASARARQALLRRPSSECCFCPNPDFFDGQEIQSELIGPFVDRRGNAKLFVHFDCACWAPQVYTDPANGQLRRVYDEYCRGRKLKCSSCGEKGATIGCYIQRCKRVFHYRCLENAQAHRVERFFAAFCQNHSHLGKKTSYKILMEAATIADVSAAQRREDTTYGLDAPHSRYTLLRRRESEVIFSRKWRMTSHTGAFDDTKVIFSHRRKLVLDRFDKLCVGDCVRVLRKSALDIASGRLAYMTLAEKGDSRKDMTAVEARAAIASRDSTGLLLLRNLRKAPRWDAKEIEVVRSIPIDISKQTETSAAEKPSADKISSIQLPSEKVCTKETAVADGVGEKQVQTPGGGSPSGTVERLRKRRRVLSDRSGENDQGASGNSKKELRNALPSTALPSFQKTHTARELRDRDKEETGSDAQVERQVGPLPQEPSLSKAQPLSHIEDEKKSDAEKAGTEVRPDVPQSSGREEDSNVLVEGKECNSVPPLNSKDDGGLKKLHNDVLPTDGKVEQKSTVKSAWEAFLEEQLPKERLLRPDDSTADALRNMARLWTFLTPSQRSAYGKVGRSPQKASPTSFGKLKNFPPHLMSNVSTRDSNTGLFSTTVKSAERLAPELKLEKKIQKPFAQRQASVSLPSLRQKRKQAIRGSSADESGRDWDELFPITIENDMAVSRCGPRLTDKPGTMESVRPAPSRGKAGPPAK